MVQYCKLDHSSSHVHTLCGKSAITSHTRNAVVGGGKLKRVHSLDGNC